MSEYLCEHDENGTDLIASNDPMLPPHVRIYECPECGMWAEYDTESETYRDTI